MCDDHRGDRDPDEHEPVWRPGDDGFVLLRNEGHHEMSASLTRSSGESSQSFWGQQSCFHIFEVFSLNSGEELDSKQC